MTETEQALLAQAARAAEQLEQAEARLRTVFIERAEADRRHRTLLRALVGLTSLVLLVLVLLVPIGLHNAENLRIVKSVTGPDAQKVQAERLSAIICDLKVAIAVAGDDEPPKCPEQAQE